MAVIPLPTRHCQVKNDDASLAKNTDHLTSTVTPEAMENATAGLGWEEIGGTAQDARVSGIPICMLHLVLRRTDIGSTREAAYVLSRKGEKLIKCGHVCKLNSEVSFSQIKKQNLAK